MGIFKTPLEKFFIQEVTRVARTCYERGWCYGTAGNFSVHVTQDRLWQSPSAKNKGVLKAESFVPILLSTGQVLEQMLFSHPSLEMPVHRRIYQARPKARVVIHCHPPNVVRLSQEIEGGNLKFGGIEMVKALGARDFADSIECAIMPNLSLKEMENLLSLESILRDVPAVILKGHGIYAWGSEPDEALGIVEAVEFILQTTCLFK